MAGDRAEISSNEIVVQFLERVEREARVPTAAELEEIRPALEDLHASLMRIRRLGGEYAKVDFNPMVWALMRAIGKKAEPVGGDSVLRRIAASFLSL